MPLLMTAAFSFSVIAMAENASTTLSISQNATQTAHVKKANDARADISSFREKLPDSVEASQTQAQSEPLTDTKTTSEKAAKIEIADKIDSEPKKEPETEIKSDSESAKSSDTAGESVAEPEKDIKQDSVPAIESESDGKADSETSIDSESKAAPGSESEDKSETDQDKLSKSESETESGAEEKAAVEPEAEPEPAEPDPFASDPYARSSLKDIEQHFVQSRTLAQKSREFGNRARAIIAGTSDNRNFRRHCEYLTRAVNNNVYAANAALLVLPRLLEVSNLICETSIKTLMSVFTDELIREPLAREIRLSEMRNLLDRQAEISRLLRNLSQQIAFFCLEAQLQSSRRHVQGRIPEFLRAANRDMIILITRQNGHLEALLNQFDHHYQFCQVNIDYFFAVSDNAPGVMQGAQLGRILRSCQDFSFSLRNYRDTFTVFAEQFAKQIEARSQGIEGLAGKGSRRAAKIADFIDNYPARDLDDMPEEKFSAQVTLQQTWNLLATIRDQASKLAADKASATSSEESETEKEESAMLRNTLDQHLDSKNWGVPDFLAPREKLKEEFADKSDNDAENDFADEPENEIDNELADGLDNELANDSTDDSADDLDREAEKDSSDRPDSDLANEPAASNSR